MKKYLIIITLIFSIFAVQAQEDVSDVEKGQEELTADTLSAEDSSDEKADIYRHRVNLYFGASMTNNIYNRIKNEDFARANYSIGSVVELKYAYFFTKHWGISIGAGLSNYRQKVTLNVEGSIEDYNDPAFSEFAGVESIYDLHYKAGGLVEKPVIWAIEIPLQLQFEHKFGGRNGIYAGLGVKGFFPISARSNFNDGGTITTQAYEHYTNTLYEDIPEYHLGTYDYTGKTAKTKLRCSIDLQADFGGVFSIGRGADFYLGVYSSLGLLDILQKEEDKSDFVSSNMLADGVKLNSLMGSTFLSDYNAANVNTPVREKWHLFQVGLKIGFHFKPGAEATTSLKDAKRRYYEEMAKKANEPIVIKNTEYVYIVPSCPTGYEEDEKLSTQEKTNIKHLAEALSDTKILFDLDKDIPKVTDNNENINKTVEILLQDPSLGLVIEGYTCDLGSEVHNRELALRRARAVRQLFINKGVNPFQIEVSTYTVKDPENRTNITKEDRAEHRAAIFRIVKR